MNRLTSYLYARPSWVEGVARLIDFANTLQVYNTSLSPEQADSLSLASDWRVIGDDFKDAMEQYSYLRSEATASLLQEAREALQVGILE